MSTVVEQNRTAGQSSSFARVPSAFRLQFAVPGNMIGAPVLVFVAAWLLALGIVFWVHQATDRGADLAVDPIYTGASQAALWCLVFMAAYSATHAFPFSMALSYSRRLFVIGAFLAFAALSLGFGAAFALAAWIEEITDGYGIHAYNFNIPFLTEGPGGILSAGLAMAVLCLFVMLVGFGFTALYHRLGLMGFWAVLLGLVVVLAAAAMLITTNGGWGTVGEWFMDQTALTLAGWLTLPTVVCGVMSYAMMRKSVPASS